MKNIVILILVGGLCGCAPALFHPTAVPPGTTQQQLQLANLECHNAAARTMPMLFGLGWWIAKRLSASAYQDCMKQAGYTVVED